MAFILTPFFGHLVNPFQITNVLIPKKNSRKLRTKMGILRAIARRGRAVPEV
jgi:hypothetical protein